MNDVSVFFEVLKQIAIAVGVISGSSVLTGITNAAINIQNNTIKHIVSWVAPILVGLLLCATNVISFGYGGWDYPMSVAAGAAVGAASNGLYDWEWVSNLIDKFYDLFGHKKEL